MIFKKYLLIKEKDFLKINTKSGYGRFNKSEEFVKRVELVNNTKEEIVEVR